MADDGTDLREKYILTAAGAALVDLVAKRMVRQLGLPVGVNTGASFGFLREHPLIVTVVAALVLAVLLCAVFFHSRLKPLSRFGLALAAGGAAANLAERMAFDVVTDWIYLPFSALVYRGGLRFNLADVEIGLGALIFLASLFFWERRGS
jgi:lipoprotein signal peptidase